jgi:nucleoid-associated protein YgaU
MTDPMPPEHERIHDRPLRARDETSSDAGRDGQSVAPRAQAPYRDDAETVRARRRELEAELRSLAERERELRDGAGLGVPPAVLPGLARRALAAVAIGSTLGVAVAIGVVSWSAIDHVELDPHAELLHRRTVARAIRSARELERTAALEAREAIDAAVRAREAEAALREREADAARISASPLFGVPSARIVTAVGPPPCGVPAMSAPPEEDDTELFVTQLGETVWDVDRAALDAPAEWSRIRLVPAREGDRVVGLRIYGVRRTSLLGRLGLENGDLLVAINRHPVADEPSPLVEAFQRSHRLVFALVRRGEPRTHTYLVRDADG